MLRCREMEWVCSRLLIRIYRSSLRVKQPCLGKLSDEAIKQRGSISSVSHLCDKKPSQQQLEGEGLMLTHRFSVPSSMVEKTWPQALAATGHTVSMARKQRQTVGEIRSLPCFYSVWDPQTQGTSTHLPTFPKLS